MASEERGVAAPRQRHPHTTPSPRRGPQIPVSRIPQRRRARTSNSAPSPHSRYGTRVTDRATPASRAMSRGRAPLIESEEIEDEQDLAPDPPYLTATSTPVSADSLINKPLPSLPVLQYGETPSRSGRDLIDATEEPARTSSPLGSESNWRSTTPTPAVAGAIAQAPVLEKTPALHEEVFELSADRTPRNSSRAAPTTSASLIAAAAELTDTINRTPHGPASPTDQRSPSIASSYASAAETTSNDSKEPLLGHTSNSKASRTAAPDDSQYSTPLPQRRSLRDKDSHGSLIPHPSGSSRRVIGYTDFTKEPTASSVLGESRPHSPSPASFSRPRPGSISLKRSGDNLKDMKTVSRLPVMDTQKATVVDIKRRTSRASSKSSQQPPQFGNRRLDAQTAEILDNGIKRRQRMRTSTYNDFSEPAGAPASTDASDNTTLESHAVSVSHVSRLRESTDTLYHNAMKSDEEMTFAQSSCDEESEITTPQDQQYSRIFDQPAKPAGKVASSRRDTNSGEVAPLHRAPPPTNASAGVLETIHSEAALPTFSAHDDEEITQALSHLEGRGSPLKQSVDTNAVAHMFGHLKNAWDKNGHETSQFRENAAVAEKFVAMHENGGLDQEQSPHMVNVHQGCSEQPPRLTIGADEEGLFNFERFEPKSKWSATTPSEKEGLEDTTHSLTSSTAQDMPQLPTRPPPDPPSESLAACAAARHVARSSIGFPSRVPAGPETLTYSSHAVADVPDIARRPTSPTLGSKSSRPKRNSREGVKPGPAGFARTTRAAEARKATRLPTPVGANVPERRGRQPSTQEQKRESISRPTTPRARSKSRQVMDRLGLGGFFHGKREKKGSLIPPVPRISESIMPPRVNLNTTPRVTGESNTSAHARAAAPTQTNPTTYQSAGTSPAAQTHAASPHDNQPPLQTQPSEATLRGDDVTFIDDSVPQDSDDDRYIEEKTEALIAKLYAGSRIETRASQKQNLRSLADAMHLSLKHTRQARQSAAMAQEAAKSARDVAAEAHAASEDTKQDLKRIHQLTADVVRSTRSRRS